MPNRILREGILSSARVNALSPAAELFYRRLISVVDDYGRFHASPGTLRGACWPTCPDRVCDQDVSKWLAECAQPDRKNRTLLVQYEVDGCKYLQLSDFKQQVRSKSKFPDPVYNCATIDEQLNSNCVSLDVVVDDIRISKAYALTGADAPHVCTQTANEWQQTADAVREYFPSTDDSFILQIAQLSCQAYNDAANGSGIKPLTDAALAKAVHKSYFEKQDSAGAFMAAVPRCIRTWAEKAVATKTRSPTAS